MPGASDMMVQRLQNEVAERRAFQDGLTDAALREGRDLNDGELELYQRAADRMVEIERQLAPMRDAARISAESAARTAEIAAIMAPARGRGASPVEYRSAGEYVADLYWSSRGEDEARGRLEMFTRAAAHQTTTDNPGLLPESIVAPLVNRVDAVRPIVSAIGVTDLQGGTWAYAKVTQHTSVAVQSAEKAELASQKMTITKTSLSPGTYGGYVNVSKQDINRTSPAIVDMVINDLAAQYAIATENVAADAIYAAATAGTNTAVVAGTSDAADITAALWTVAGQAFTGMQGAGSLFLAISPDLLGAFGPAFGTSVQIEGAAPSGGFSIAGFGSGAVGQISGIPVVVSAGMNSNRAMLVNTAAVRVFEYKYGNMQVNEPSVWGVQVGYAGDFAVVITDATGVIALDTTA